MTVGLRVLRDERLQRRLGLIVQGLQPEGPAYTLRRLGLSSFALNSTAPTPYSLWGTPRPSPRVPPPTSVSSTSTSRSPPMRSLSGRTMPTRSLCNSWKAVS